MSIIGIIGGSGLTSLQNLRITHREMVHTPWGVPSAPVVFGTVAGREVVFLPRHGNTHSIPPHKVNYCANLWALKECGVRQVIAVAAVGGIHEAMYPGRLAVPDQIIDYTWGRKSTFFEEDLQQVTHIDFTEPYDSEMRRVLLSSGKAVGIDIWDGGTYGATQGPRLETRAEIERMRRDGCDMVGMTGMPEAALAREIGLRYVTCALSVNWAAGIAPGTIEMEEIDRHLKEGIERVKLLLEAALPVL